MISRIHLPISRLRRRDPEDVLEVERQPDHDQVGEHAEPGEDEEQRAGDLVQRPRVAVGAVLRDELDHRAAVAEVEDREVDGHAGREHPQAVGLRAQVRAG